MSIAREYASPLAASAASGKNYRANTRRVYFPVTIAAYDAGEEIFEHDRE